MSWLFKSLQPDDPLDSTSSSPPDHPPQESPTNRGGVKDDLSVIGESIGRQLRGVANFLAPPPSPPSTADNNSQLSGSGSGQSQALLGVRKDLEEIGGSLKSSLSLLSSSGISKLTTTLLQFHDHDNERRDDEDDDYIPGITDEVLNFVKEISARPECWTDFPLSLETDLKMSDAQREHALTVEHMVPSLADLRANLHSYMGDEQFWLIYFILVLPRMNEEDLEILSSQEIVETRSLLLQKLQNTRNMKVENSDASHDDISNDEKEVTEIVNHTGSLRINDGDNADQWLKEAEVDPRTSLDGKKKKLEPEDDVSFSDLEDDENDLASRLSGSGQVGQFVRTPSPSGSSDWVQLNESSGNLQKARLSISREKDSDAESNDWLKVGDSD
ncbi:BSD domain-containing protein [Euphorbia peplus]|nr:BSD domain-containing protein [Euphorbia peplus]